MDSDPLPGRGSLNADVVAIDPFALATVSFADLFQQNVFNPF